MRTSVITIAHGRHRHLRRQSEGLQMSTVTPDLRVVVAMDDPQVPANLDDDTIVVDYPCEPPWPLARARNLGADAALSAGAQLLIFLDVDCIPSVQLIARYQDIAQQRHHADALLCGPVTYLDPPPRGGYDLASLPGLVAPHPARPMPADSEVIATQDYSLFWSLSFALTAHTWRQIGGFHEEYRGYGGEDTDFALRAAAAEVPMRWVGGANAFHQHHPVQKPPVEHLDDILRNAAIFHRRWGRWPMQGWLDAFQEQGLIVRDQSGTPAIAGATVQRP